MAKQAQSVAIDMLRSYLMCKFGFLKARLLSYPPECTTSGVCPSQRVINAQILIVGLLLLPLQRPAPPCARARSNALW